MQTLLQDLHFAVRQLRNSPGFAALAVLTLAFGIGANTAMFTVVENVLIRRLPYAHPDRLVRIGPPIGSGLGNTSWLNYRDVRDQTRNMDLVGCYAEDVAVVRGMDGSVSVVAPGVTPSVFKMLGARPLLGRTFTEEESQPGAPKTAVISEGLWRNVFHSDPEILSRTVTVNGQPRAIVGVMPRDFRFPESVGQEMQKGLWLPLQPTAEMQTARGESFFAIIGELKPGVTVAQGHAELTAIVQRIHELDPKTATDLSLRAIPYQETLTGPVAPVFLALLVAVGLVLLIACANVANLLIARCLVRQQEFAVRAALGAGQWRLMRQLIAEGALLSALGCAFGFALAAFAIELVHKLPPDTIPRAENIGLRWTVVLVLAAIATVTTVLSAFLPAWIVSRSDPQRVLQGASRGLGARSVRRRLSGAVVAGEVALSALLLVATGLLFHTLWNLEHVQLGFDVTRVTTFTAMPADASGFAGMTVSSDVAHAPTSVATLVYQPVLERMRNTPGVEDAALDTAPPFSGIDLHSSFDIVGRPKHVGEDGNARVTAMSGGYARLMRTPMIRGRMISDDDTESSPFVIVINETLARKYFAGKDPLGTQLDLGGKDTGMIRPYTIVGVIGDQVDASTSQPPQPVLMIPCRQVPTSSLFYPALVKTVVNFMVKTRGEVAVAPAMRSVFHELAPDYALDDFQTMQQAVDQSNFSSRIGLYLTGVFAGMAVMMVIAGLYGVLAQLVSYRRREFGIRLALGATPNGISGMVLRQGLVFVGAGLVIGIVAAVFAGNLVKSFLYQVQPADAWTYLGVVFLLLLVGSVAALIPAHRAATVEPMTALREE
ncbi:MAG TPA: ABC transporter permease [Candidatus Acidoferrales bacterium]|nr:ABC transporter permease [Candidatus Acidoferrales bacterium]